MVYPITLNPPIGLVYYLFYAIPAAYAIQAHGELAHIGDREDCRNILSLTSIVRVQGNSTQDIAARAPRTPTSHL